MIIIVTYILTFLLIAVIFFIIIKTFIIAYTSFTDVPYLPIEQKYLHKATEILRIQKGDEVLDIGSGDGKFLIYAAKKHPEANFTGIERNLLLVYWTKTISYLLRIKNLKFYHQDALNFNYQKYNKIYTYLIPSFLDKILPIVEQDVMKNTIVISCIYKMGYIFSKTHKIEKYPVKYESKSKNIFKWTKQ